ncbi:MAG TPA: TonB-dependent receptor plug domain-containing protein, partial [Phnomibacter sp.]|nr:TonB-dependent receptor plug domain-containing protein [Phnomibacter sp.]
MTNPDLPPDTRAKLKEIYFDGYYHNSWCVLKLSQTDKFKGTPTEKKYLQVVANNGAPGAATTIRIRGNSSLRSGNNPLFVVDGIPLDGRLARPGLNIPDVGNTPESNPLYFFNANDIASMEVQKDASATAIYGSRAANGVVQIITKQGSSGPAKIDFAASLGVSNILRRFEVMDAAGYKAAAQAYNVQLPQGDNADVNALDEILQTGITQNYNLGIGGGNENGRYRFSFGYMDQNGIIKRTNLRRFTINANGQYKLLKSRKLSLDYNLYLGQARENIAPITNDAGFLGNLIGMALQWRPTEPLYLNNDKNRPNIIPGSSVINPVAFQRGYTDISNISSMFGVVGVGYKIVKDLDYKMNVSLTKQTGIRQSAMNRWITLPAIENRGLGAVGNSQMTTTVIQHTLQYNKKISQNFNINSIIGYEYQDFGWSGSSARGIGFANDDVPLYNIIQNAPAAGRQISAFEDPDASIQSYFARAILNFQDKYLLTATFRADGSSRFGDNNKYGYFPSLAARWNLHSEEFMKNSNTF